MSQFAIRNEQGQVIDEIDAYKMESSGGWLFLYERGGTRPIASFSPSSRVFLTRKSNY